MPAMTASAVTRNEVWKGGGTSGRKYKYLDVTLALSTHGGATNYIGKALFGLSAIKGCSLFRTTDGNNTLFPMAPSSDGEKLLNYNDAGNLNQSPADNTATIRGIVWGVEG